MNASANVSFPFLFVVIDDGGDGGGGEVTHKKVLNHWNIGIKNIVEFHSRRNSKNIFATMVSILYRKSNASRTSVLRWLIKFPISQTSLYSSVSLSFVVCRLPFVVVCRCRNRHPPLPLYNLLSTATSFTLHIVGSFYLDLHVILRICRIQLHVWTSLKRTVMVTCSRLSKTERQKFATVIKRLSSARQTYFHSLIYTFLFASYYPLIIIMQIKKKNIFPIENHA